MAPERGFDDDSHGDEKHGCFSLTHSVSMFPSWCFACALLSQHREQFTRLRSIHYSSSDSCTMNPWMWFMSVGQRLQDFLACWMDCRLL